MPNSHPKKTKYLSQLATATILVALTATAQADPSTTNIPTLTDTSTQQKAEQLQQNAAETIQNLQALSTTSLAVNNQPTAVSFSPYPVTTTLMTLSQAGNDTMTLPSLSQAIFFVGSDNYSTQWLQQHLVQLQTSHAIGILVQAQSEEEAKPLLQLADNLQLIPLSGDSFAKQWHINHYPLLITPAHN